MMPVVVPGSNVIHVCGTFFHHISTEIHLDHVSFPVKFGDDGAPHVSNALGMLNMNEE